MITIAKPKINTGPFNFGKRHLKPVFTPTQEKARSGMLAFSEYVYPGWQTNWHHVVICDALDRLVFGDIKRLMILLPPRHGKSQLVSIHLPAFILGHFPSDTIIAASYSADLVRTMNRKVQRLIDSPRYKELFPNTQLFGKNIRTLSGRPMRNSDEFEIVEHFGGYKGVGVGGSITGRGMNWGLPDDLLKGREQANSPTIREKTFEWLMSDFLTRQAPNARIVYPNTRWHEDDPAGRLIEKMQTDPTADQWTVIKLPAIAEEPLAEYDQRADGEVLWESRFPKSFIFGQQSNLSEYEFASLYQQNPVPKGGGEFKREWFHDGVFVGAVPNGAKFCRYWDKAGSKDKGAHTAGVLLATVNREFYVVDMIMGQWGAPEREAIIKQTAILDNEQYGRVVIAFEQEPGSGGLESAQNTVKNLAGFIVKADRPSGDKVLRSEPVQTQAEKGNLKIVKGVWNRRFLDILCSFPNGKIKDPVDALSGAFKYLTSSNSVSYADIANLGEVDRTNSPWG